MKLRSFIRPALTGHESRFKRLVSGFQTAWIKAFRKAIIYLRKQVKMVEQGGRSGEIEVTDEMMRAGEFILFMHSPDAQLHVADVGGLLRKVYLAMAECQLAPATSETP